MTKLTILTAQDKLTEIRRLYFATRKQTIGDDLARAVQLLKSMETEEERERATVYMEGLAQMQKDWARESRGGKGRPSGPSASAGKRSAKSGTQPGKPAGKPSAHAPAAAKPSARKPRS